VQEKALKIFKEDELEEEVQEVQWLLNMNDVEEKMLD